MVSKKEKVMVNGCDQDSKMHRSSTEGNGGGNELQGMMHELFC